jgi:hypothetical protein
VTHGTLTAYKRHKCRCADCRVANRDYMRAARAKAKNIDAATFQQTRWLLACERNRTTALRRELEAARGIAIYWKARCQKLEASGAA